MAVQRPNSAVQLSVRSPGGEAPRHLCADDSSERMDARGGFCPRCSPAIHPLIGCNSPPYWLQFTPLLARRRGTRSAGSTHRYSSVPCVPAEVPQCFASDVLGSELPAELRSPPTEGGCGCYPTGPLCRALAAGSQRGSPDLLLVPGLPLPVAGRTAG